jgi:hypothetical protein
VRPHVCRVLVAQVGEAHRLLDVLEVVQVREWEAVDLSSGSTVITEHVVMEPSARHGELVLRAGGGCSPGGTVVRPGGSSMRAGHLAYLRPDCSKGPGRGTVFEESPPGPSRAVAR